MPATVRVYGKAEIFNLIRRDMESEGFNVSTDDKGTFTWLNGSHIRNEDIEFGVEYFNEPGTNIEHPKPETTKSTLSRMKGVGIKVNP